MSKLKVNVSLEFLRALVEVKVQKGATIIAGLIAQALKLTGLPIPVADLTTANNNLIQGIQDAASGSHADIEKRNQLEAKWITVFREDANFVSQIANGDAAFILLCGLDPTSSETTPSLPAIALEKLVAVPVSTPGCVEVSMAKQLNAAGFVTILAPETVTVIAKGDAIEITFNGASVFIIPNTHNHFSLSGLISKVTLAVFGVAFNLHGTGPLTKSGNNITPQ